MSLREAVETNAPESAEAVIWRDGKWWVGYWIAFPDHLTQGKTREELDVMLRDIWALIHDGSLGDVPRPEDPRVVSVALPAPLAAAA